MISRTSCAHRHDSAMRVAHLRAFSREGTPMIENPPTAALVFGNRSAGVSGDGRLLVAGVGAGWGIVCRHVSWP